LVAPNAPFAPCEDRRPVILLSHGYGGTARIMGWFGIALARNGCIVVAVDHPGNNGVDKMTVAGAVLSWDRPEDLRAALNAAENDQTIGPHVDLSRVGVTGFSAGGFTTLVAAFAMAPALVQALEPASLEHMRGSDQAVGRGRFNVVCIAENDLYWYVQRAIEAAEAFLSRQLTTAH
jgi:predicted dienelactone hydrolase